MLGRMRVQSADLSCLSFSSFHPWLNFERELTHTRRYNILHLHTYRLTQPWIEVENPPTEKPNSLSCPSDNVPSSSLRSLPSLYHEPYMFFFFFFFCFYPNYLQILPSSSPLLMGVYIPFPLLETTFWIEKNSSLTCITITLQLQISEKLIAYALL